MWILKAIGGILVIISSSLLGYLYGSKYSNRVKNIIHLQNCIQLLETEIIYSATPLPDALDNVYKKGNKRVSYIFKDIKDHIKENRKTTVLDSFIYESDKLKNELNLTKEDIEIFLSLGRIIGKSDRNDQQKHFKSVLTQLYGQQKDAEIERNKNEKLYKNLGILMGLAIVIILI